MRRLATAPILFTCLAAVLALGATRHHKPVAPPPPPPRLTVELGETRPIETALGDRTLPTGLDEWLDMIRGAKDELDLEHFYLSRKSGEALDPVLDEIGKAAARGVKVRLLLDAGMHRTYPQPADSLAALAGVSARFVDYHRLAGGVQHAKFMIVDGREAWLGSQNLDWRSLSHIHELGARVRMPAVALAIGDLFETDWAAADTTRKAAPIDAHPAWWPQLFDQDGVRGKLWLSASPRALTPASIAWDRDVLVARVNDARQEIVAQTLTYGTSGYGESDSTLHRALLAAAARGVHVMLLVSDWEVGGRGEADLRALAAAPNVEVRISKVADWSRGYIPFSRVEHCKYMVADSAWLWLGTSNWEPSYFSSSRNLAMTVEHAPLARRARGIFEASWTAPSAVPLTAGQQFTRRTHAEKPPPGMTLYGE
jgi:phosphatidylserine/phosphatidylglycerophosphate/cardiolipin synthase-like enzyme